MRLVKSVSISLAAKLVSFIIAFPTSIIIARYLGPSGKGTFAVLATITGMTLQLGNLGFHSSSAYFSAKNKERISQIAGILIMFGLTIGIVSGIGIATLSLIFPKIVLGKVPYIFLLITLAGLPFAFISLFLQNLLLGMQKIYEYNFIDLAARFLTLLAIAILFLFFRTGVFELIVASTVIMVLTSFASGLFTKRNTPISLGLDYRF